MQPDQSIQYSEPSYKLKQSLEDILYPALQPHQSDLLQVSALHKVWYAQYGNSQGIPVIVLHGGPGYGCGPNDMRYFDSSYYRIILMDQRGAKRSQPFGELVENNTQNLIQDIDMLREHLKIDKWLVFGGSWGSLLALAYGQAHPARCLGFVLRGIFLGRRADADNLWYGMQDIFPDYWHRMQEYIPDAEREDLFAAYYKRLIDTDPAVNIPAARAFMEYDLKAGVLVYEPDQIDKLLSDEATILGAARMFAHYCSHNFFLADNQILANMHKIEHLPARMVQGRYDIICRPKSAYELLQRWPQAELVFVQDAGHTTAEPGIAKYLIKATDNLYSHINTEL